ncbi:WhiB family transcriptional regulator [Streptomyces sp. Tue6028]|uniref:WhiB family transcriptional regulator n=1 Tax=Streptomyces sp. Tue6028 TaxID=2036037 RepID=UPI003EB8068B
MSSRHLAPILEHWDWQLQAACRDMDSSVFFSPAGERGKAKRNREAAARRICRRCPVQSSCRNFAVTTQQPYGVWGGLTESNRRTRPRAAKRSRADTSPLAPATTTPRDPA